MQEESFIGNCNVCMFRRFINSEPLTALPRAAGAVPGQDSGDGRDRHVRRIVLDRGHPPGTPYTLHPTPYTLHHTLHPSPYTLNPKP